MTPYRAAMKPMVHLVYSVLAQGILLPPAAHPGFRSRWLLGARCALLPPAHSPRGAGRAHSARVAGCRPVLMAMRECLRLKLSYHRDRPAEKGLATSLVARFGFPDSGGWAPGGSDAPTRGWTACAPDRPTVR